MRKALIIILCALGLIVGVTVGDACSGMSGLSWLAIGTPVGFDTFTLNLGVVNLTLGLDCYINVGAVVGLILFAVIGKFLTQWLKI